MKTVRYVNLDPTGNLTCLVLDAVEQAEEKEVTRRLMEECEQVAYLEPATLPGSRARARLMGGEFCGNAAMAVACYLADRDGIAMGETRTVPIEMSGAPGILACTVKAVGDSFTGTVPMPPVRGIRRIEGEDYPLAAVALDGIAHLILAGPPFPEDAEAERMLRRLAEERPEDAVGLLLWDGEKNNMRPLVLVKGSGTLVWETGCGSGSAAMGAFLAQEKEQGTAESSVLQPGGVIRVSAACRNGAVESLSITGRVRLGEEKTLIL
ncbi:MAG: hypothetical protein K5746_01350 [Clostridiales bacterium]|nr:hypothetical protein [Clostridiales bacterium]